MHNYPKVHVTQYLLKQSSLVNMKFKAQGLNYIRICIVQFQPPKTNNDVLFENKNKIKFICD